MPKTVISQSMYFPWVGFLEQVKLADIFIHYNDVQLSRGFYNRVQVKTQSGSKWITVPLRDHHQGQKISETLIDDRQDWKKQHRRILHHSYRTAPFFDDMIKLVDAVFDSSAQTLADISKTSIMTLVNYFGLAEQKQFIDSANLGICGSSSQRLIDICKRVKANIYITGLGALNYLEHELFEHSGIEVRYMDYKKHCYPQLHGDFTPFVTALDLVANCGKSGIQYIDSPSVNWKEFVNIRKTT